MDEKFSAMLSVILVPQIIDIIIKKEKMIEDEALVRFYLSKTYKLLSDEESKLWHYSPLTARCFYVDIIQED
jgi:Cu/Ag efflux pump CusA